MIYSARWLCKPPKSPRCSTRALHSPPCCCLLFAFTCAWVKGRRESLARNPRGFSALRAQKVMVWGVWRVFS